MGLFLVSVAVVLNVVANGLFKESSLVQPLGMHKIALIAGGLGFGFVSTLCYIKSLDKIELGLAFPLFSAASIILITLVSVLIFKEGLSPLRATGIAVICLGLVLLWKA
jgi:multidrug transporter EmrE-like cation transporter